MADTVLLQRQLHGQFDQTWTDRNNMNMDSTQRSWKFNPQMSLQPQKMFFTHSKKMHQKRQNKTLQAFLHASWANKKTLFARMMPKNHKEPI